MFIVEDITPPYGRGLREYLKAETSALNSDNFKSYVESKYFKEVRFSSVEVYTYSDIHKYFNKNEDLGKNFTSKMEQNKNGTTYKSIYFARIESDFFDITFQSDNKDFFFETSINEDLKSNTNTNFKEGNPYYISKMTYGDYAYLAIESEYPFEDVKSAIEYLFKLGKESNNNSQTEKILAKSVITIMTSYNNKLNLLSRNWANDINALGPLFVGTFSLNHIGKPISIEVRDVLTHTTYNSGIN